MRRTTAAAAPLRAHPDPARYHTCLECPVCGTEECRVMADLGMSCDTAQAAQEARAGEGPRPRRATRRGPVRRY